MQAIQKIGELLPAVLAGLQSPELALRSRLVSEWPAIAGAKIAEHTRPTLNNAGELWVWVDQSTLAFELNQRYRGSLLKRAQAALGEEAVKDIRFRVGQLRG
jgi:predicted nucleic acid-binding Zn ribbon protein